MNSDITQPRLENYCINVVSITDIGQVRDQNEDSVAHFSHPTLPYAFAVVADGMGGYSGGATASRIATDAIYQDLTHFSQTNLTLNNLPACTEKIKQQLQTSVAKANRLILEQKLITPEFAHMGTTLVITVLCGDQLISANIGDSRAYKLQGNQLIQYTKDHSVVQELVDNGAITPEEAQKHQNRNQLTRAVGIQHNVSADIYAERLTGDCVLLLCSDGLTEYLTDSSLYSMLQQPKSPLEHCYNMVDTANSKGGKDNISVAIIEFARL